MSKREYFDIPVVRVESSRIRFPKICPVCGQPATKTARIQIAWDQKDYQGQYSYVPHYMRGPRRLQSQSPSKVLLIPVCEDHNLTYDEQERIRSLCIVVNGFALAFLFFGLLLAGDALWRGRSIPPFSFSVILFFSASLLAGLFAFRRNVLERAVRIVGFDAGIRHILIRFEKDQYRDEFLAENSMSSELIRWIVKSKG